MNKLMKMLFLILIFITPFTSTCLAQNNMPQLFVFLEGDAASAHKNELSNPHVTGAQIIYSWKQLEPKKDTYDFSKIERDLLFLSRLDKKLFIQLQDRSFEPTIFYVPDYIRKDKIYHGGIARQYDFPGEGKPITTGWVARIWDPAVKKRFQLLMVKLAAQFDGRIYGINLPETAVDFDLKNPPKDFTFDNYFHAEIENIGALKKAFHKSIVIQYVNFLPGEWNNDHHYMSTLFSYAAQHNIGLGGPDTVPYRKGQMKNSYPFFHQYKGNLLVGMAIQEPDYTYKNPATGDYYTFSDFYDFSTKYLNASILFWNVQEPFFSKQLVPKLNEQYFE